MDYDKSGWPVATTRAVTSPETPEEAKLNEMRELLAELRTGVALARGTVADQILRLEFLLEEVLDVVSDYSHLHAQVEELEAEVDDRDEKIAALEERVVELDETYQAEAEERIANSDRD